MAREGSLLGGTLLVAGTAIGGGMLALPVLTAPGGFIPSLFIYILCWLFMSTMGLLFLEVSLSMPEGANIVTMAERTLGNFGKCYAWLLYLFLFYCLSVAYLVGGGDLLTNFLPVDLPPAAGSLLFALLFAPPVMIGTRLISGVNGVFMIILAVLYCIFIAIGAPHIQWPLLERSNWPLSLMSLPVAFTAFAYQGIIPTLVHYLKRDVRALRIAILVGSGIPLVTYIVWQGLILGIIPPEELAVALKNGQNAVQPLKNVVDQPLLLIVGQLFAFIALLTSFFGVTLGLADFLADGLKCPNRGWRNKAFLALLVFTPPLVIAVVYPHLFLIALDAAGGFGCALLLGLLPIMMVWVGRYHLHRNSHQQVGGGKILLVLLALFVAFEVTCEILLAGGYFS